MKAFLNKLKTKKLWILLLIVLAVIIVICAVKFFHKENEAGENLFSQRVKQIINLSVEPYSDDDEPYTVDNDEKIQYKIKVNKKNNVIIVYKKNSKGKYKEAFKSMTCSVGRDVPLGDYKIGDKYVWKIVNGNVWAQYATRLDGSIMFQSVPFSEKRKDSLIVKYYNQLGTNCNASAIRLNVADAKWIVENVATGTSVEIFEDDDIGPLGKPNVLELSDDILWDPSDPDPANPGSGSRLSFKGLSDRTVERGIAIDYLMGVSVVNESGTELSANIEVESDVDVFKCGIYDVTYSVRDSSGSIIEKKVAFKVVDTLKPVFSGLPNSFSIQNVDSISESALREGIYVIDNNQFISSDRIKVTIPFDIKDGDYISFSVTDDYGNEASANVLCKIDTTPPEIELVSGIMNVISLEETVNEEFALSRVTATDSGVELSRDHIKVDISTNDWGYTFNYTVTDDSGLTAQLQNTVSYPIYTIDFPDSEIVDDLSDISLLKGVQIKDTFGNIVTAENIKVSSQVMSGDRHKVKYVYEYSSPLGNKTAQAERVVIIAGDVDDDSDEDVKPTQTPKADSTEEIIN